eukprot:TRINITY_DN45103_c0_g1_i1.p1 TRINITY_DN45103_c0_g1~~TRINITY_DN45103_c0_g1_i1.p1  ORF type:complete len:1075 (-),score=131.81 TRINITY_DN45103_c0_g1_i1:44-3268(-)
MVLEAAAGVLGGTHALWNYNRENFKYDREMRLKQELQVMDFRTVQAELWREDIRDIVGLTEKRMDSYLLVACLQLGMCVTLWTEGRVPPGTPPWLVDMYMLTLGAAFMYLLMGVWFALHAMVVAQCTSVRLLTQAVRLPVPTWPQLEAARTYATDFEELGVRSMLRVPFSDALGHSSQKKNSRGAMPPPEACGGVQKQTGHSASSLSSAAPSGPEATVDPWSLEREREDIYELMRIPCKVAYHVRLAQRSATSYQCYDSFARVAMSFGTNQLLSAIGNYVFGYCGVQIHALAAAWCVSAITACMGFVVLELDISLTRRDVLAVRCLIVGSVCCVGLAMHLFVLQGMDCLLLVRAAFCCQCTKLLFTMSRLQPETQPCGGVLPVKFRPTLYQDIFGWVRKGKSTSPRIESVDPTEVSKSSVANHISTGSPEDLLSEESAEVDRLRVNISTLQRETVQKAMCDFDKNRVASLMERLTRLDDSRSSASVDLPHQQGQKNKHRNLVQMRGYSDFGAEIPFFVDSETGDVLERSTSRSSFHSITETESAFDKLERKRALAMRHRDTVVPHYDRVDTDEVCEPQHSSLCGPILEGEETAPLCSLLPDRCRASESGSSSKDTFSKARNKNMVDDMHQGLYDFSATFPDSFDNESTDKDRRQLDMHLHPGRMPWRLFQAGTYMLAGLWALTLVLPLAIRSTFGAESEASFVSESKLLTDVLFGGEIMKVSWPHYSSFSPRSLSESPSGMEIVVSDDFNIYSVRRDSDDIDVATPAVKRLLEAAVERPSSVALRGSAAGQGSTSASVVSGVSAFMRAPHCPALEGEGIVDAAVVCTKATRISGLPCLVMILHSHGTKMSPCPLKGDPPVDLTGASNTSFSTKTWTISQDWLHGDDAETISALAVSRFALEPGHTDSMCRKGCIVVGTTSGRLVELRRSYAKTDELVPQRIVRQRPHTVAAGTLDIFQSSFIMTLLPEAGLLQAISLDLGVVSRQWSLPDHINWKAVCGGGERIYLLGVRKRPNATTAKDLWLFPTPKSLRELAAELAARVEREERVARDAEASEQVRTGQRARDPAGGQSHEM